MSIFPLLDWFFFFQNKTAVPRWLDPSFYIKCFWANAFLLPGCYHDIDGMKNMFFDLPEDSIVYGDRAYTDTTMKKFAERHLE